MDNKKPESAEPIDLEKEFSLDKAKASNGVLVPYKSAKLRIASTSCRAFQNARDLLWARYPTKESLESDEAQAKYEALLAQYILLGWENFTVPYSFEAAKKYLHIDGFRRWVMSVATSDSYFKAEETDLKN